MAIRIFPESVRKMQASRSMRLKHELWHFVRAVWGHPRFPDAGRDILNDLGWGLPEDRAPFSASRHLLLDNFSGEDFLFMHREMIAMTNRALESAGEPPISRWESVPEPGHSEFPVPPPWTYDDPGQSDEENERTSNFLIYIKSDQYYETTMKVREDYLTNPANLGRLSLGAVGNIAEMTIHNAMHMRWSSEPSGYRSGIDLNDPTGGDPKWDALDYDYLGDTYSSHVNPHFWHLHGWIDNLIDHWAAANGVDEIAWLGTWTGGPDLVPVLTSSTEPLAFDTAAETVEVENQKVQETAKKLAELSSGLSIPKTLLQLAMEADAR